MKNKFLEREKTAVEKRHWIRIDNACNNQCIFCLDKENQNGSFISLPEVKKMLAVGRRQGAKRLILSGGEATIHPDFIKIVERAKAAGYAHIQVITNGRMFVYNDFLQAALKAGLKEITFSIHGHNEALHDKQTGIRGSFRQSLGGLMNALRAPGLIVSVDIVISKQNYKQLADILKFFIALGVREFDLLQVIPFGRAWENRKHLFYNFKKAKPYLTKAFDLSKNKDLFIWTNRFPAKYLEGFEYLIQHPQKIIDEIKGRENYFAALLGRGKTLPCFPKRCQFCFLRDFCRDLMEFNKKGEIDAKQIPVCLPKKLKSKTTKKLKKDKNTDIYNFFDFYAAHRYFLKGSHCAQCRFDKTCCGAPIQFIRQFGFVKLKPIS